MYILFTNDLPDVIHSQHEEPLSYKQPSMQCDPCGSLVNYVDDGTYTFSHWNPNILSTVLTNKYKVIEEYMVANKLVINADKTHLVVMGTRRSEAARQVVELRAGQHTIHPSETEKLLGCSINQNLKWQTHIQTGESSLLKQLNSRLNGLKKVSTLATFQTRLSAANGVFMSVLSYLIPLWGGCEGYLIKAVQVLQNRAARQVTKLSWFTPTRKLLKQCNWLSIKQLIFYHTALTVFRTIKTKTPLYLSEHLPTEHPYPTRLATGGGIRIDGNGNHGGLVKNSFLVRAAQDFNSIPASIRMCGSLQSFKYQIRKWIKINVPID